MRRLSFVREKTAGFVAGRVHGSQHETEARTDFRNRDDQLFRLHRAELKAVSHRDSAVFEPLGRVDAEVERLL